MKRLISAVVCAFLLVAADGARAQIAVAGATPMMAINDSCRKNLNRGQTFLMCEEGESVSAIVGEPLVLHLTLMNGTLTSDDTILIEESSRAGGSFSEITSTACTFTWTPREAGTRVLRFEVLEDYIEVLASYNVVVMVSSDGVRVSASIREADPTVMDVHYIFYADPATTPLVNVRVLAFENGDRGFATIIRPETFIEGTDANIGDGITANVEHLIAWRVPSDWETDLAKVSFEVLVMKPGDLLLPMHFVTIPAIDGDPAAVVSVNDLSVDAYGIASGWPADICRDTNSDIYLRWWGGGSGFSLLGHRSLMNALLWMYASGEGNLSIVNGALRSNGKDIVRHAAFAKRWNATWGPLTEAFAVVFEHMGYRLLQGAELSWINESARLGLMPEDFRQYAIKTFDE